MSDIYLSLTETPSVVTLSQPVVSGVLSSNVTVTNVVSVNVVTMPAITVQAAAPAVTTVAGSVAVSNFPASQVVSVSNFPASSSVTIANFPSVTTVAGTVALDSASLIALENVTVTVGAAVTVAGFSTSSLPPSTVTVANTVTIAGTVTANVSLSNVNGGPPPSGFPVVAYDEAISGGAQIVPVQLNTLNGTVEPNNPLPISGTVTVGNSVTIGSLPAISGTVTANVPALGSAAALGASPIAVIGQNQNSPNPTHGIQIGYYSDISGTFVNVQDTGYQQLPVKGTVTIGSCVTHGVRLQDASGNNLTSTSIGGVQRLNVSLASAATPGGTLPTFVNVYGGSDSGTVRALAVDSSGRTVVTVSNFPATQAVSLASTTVTVSALPSGSLTTRFGSVTTANLSQITTAVTNTSRKYLLAQNISTGSVTIGIGFSPTTTQGIQLTAGAGLTFDAFCPTGAVYWLGAVTGAAWTILEG